MKRRLSCARPLEEGSNVKQDAERWLRPEHGRIAQIVWYRNYVTNTVRGRTTDRAPLSRNSFEISTCRLSQSLYPGRINWQATRFHRLYGSSLHICIYIRLNGLSNSPPRERWLDPTDQLTLRGLDVRLDMARYADLRMITVWTARYVGDDTQLNQAATTSSA